MPGGVNWPVRMLLSCRLKTLGRFFFLVFLLVFYCEFVHYYLVLLHCTWPSPAMLTWSRLEAEDDSTQKPLRVMILADTHLLGFKNGHWFDKLRREWQMERSYQTAMTIHHPDAVFVLGDLLDEGKWCSDSEFEYHVKRFKKMFSTPAKSDLHVVVGNHDIGFHYMISDEKKRRFESAMNAPSVRAIQIQGVQFVLVNSMALEGDGCSLCREAELELQTISSHLNCAKAYPGCSPPQSYLPYSKPILMQHFPMYRDSDSNCSLPDSAPANIRYQKFTSKIDCLSRTATKKLFSWLEPRLVVSGHTHHGCYRVHDNQVPEWTVSSFSWRNKKEPSFLLMLATSDDFSIHQCFLPNEGTVIWIYILGGVFIFIFTIVLPRHVNKPAQLARFS